MNREASEKALGVTLEGRNRRADIRDESKVGKPIGREKYQRLIAAAQSQTRIKVAVVHPCDDVSLRGAIEASKLGLIEPILVAPPERLGNVAKEAHLDISGLSSSRLRIATIPPPRRSAL